MNIKAIGHALARDVESRVHTTTGASRHKELFMDNGKVTLYYSSEFLNTFLKDSRAETSANAVLSVYVIWRSL